MLNLQNNENKPKKNSKKDKLSHTIVKNNIDLLVRFRTAPRPRTAW